MEDCEVSYSSAGYGIASSATTADYIYNNTFRRCHVHHNYKSGIVIGTSDPGYPYNMLIDDCEVNNNGTSTSGDHGIYVDGGVTVRGCSIYSNSSAGINFNDEFGLDARYLPVAYNNTIYLNRHGFYMSHDYAKIYNNLVYANTNASVQFVGSIGNCEAYFNTFVNFGCR